jgi:hypothetical protein
MPQQKIDLESLGLTADQVIFKTAQKAQLPNVQKKSVEEIVAERSRKAVGTSEFQASVPTPLETTVFDLKVKAVALAIVAGLNEHQGSAFVGCTEQQFRDLRDTSKCSELVAQASASATLSPEQRIARAIPTVVDKKIRVLLTSKDEKTVMAVGTELMDRHYGKPIQTTQSFGMNIMAHTSLEDLQAKQKAVTDRLAQIERSRRLLKDSTKDPAKKAQFVDTIADFGP